MNANDAKLLVGESEASHASIGDVLVWSRAGVAWRQLPTGASGTPVRSICFGSSQFVAVRHRLDNGVTTSGAATSPDGMSWSWWSVPSSSQWESIAYGAGVYVAVASGSTAGGLPRSMYSADGKRWRPSNLSTASGWRAVCHGSAGFVAIASATVSVSVDGIQWQAATSLPGGSSWRSVAFGNGLYVAVASSGTNRVATSPDGVNWTPRAAPGSSAWYAVTFRDGLFVASATSGTSRVMTSQDGEVWSLRPSLFGGSSVAAGGGIVVCGGGEYSQDLAAWRIMPRKPASQYLSICHGNGRFVASFSSEDGAVYCATSGSLNNTSGAWLDIEEIPRVTQSESVSSGVTVGDANVSRRTSASHVTDYAIRVSSAIPNADEYVIETSNGNVLASPSQSGIASYVSSGEVTVSATRNGVSVPPVVVRTFQWSSGQVDEFVSYRPESAAYSASSAIDSAISPSPQRAIFSTKNHTNGVYERSIACWAASITDLTCVSVWNSVNGAARCGTLITPRHVIYAAHYPLSVGAVLRFVTTDNQIVSRTITQKTTATGYGRYYPDYEVAMLDSDVPASVGVARVLPQSWRSYLPSVSSGLGSVPVISINQNEEASVADFYKDDGAMMYCRAPSSQQRLGVFSPLVFGDSGHPCFLVPSAGSPPVLLTVWTFGLAGSGTSLASHSQNINGILSSLGGGYHLTPVDLSGFPSY